MSLARPSLRWQTSLTDLALILFLLSAAALEYAPRPASASDLGAKAAPAKGVALLAWRETAQSPPLGQWLAELPPDSTGRLSITVTYPPGGLSKAMARTQALLAEAGASAHQARITLVPGQPAGALAELAQEAPRPEAEYPPAR